MATRSEEDIVAMTPLSVTLGKTEYKIKLLGMTPQREWRTKLNTALFPIVESFTGKTLADALRGGLAAALIQFPEAIAELVFQYAPDLPRETIMQEATEEQMAQAFAQIQSVAYPFLPQLKTATQLWLQAKQQA